MINRLKEILNELDVDIYWKTCNSIVDEDDGLPIFYSRDICHTITFKELLLWYLPQLGQWQDEPVCTEEGCEFNCEKCDNFKHMSNCDLYVANKRIKDKHYNLFMELVDIYAYYNSQDYKKYNDLKDKLRIILE